MKDKEQPKEVLEKELTELRERITELESSKAEHDRLQKEYDEINENYKLLTENISDVIFITDVTFTLIDCSKSVERVSGYKIDELVGKPFNELKLLTPASLQNTYKNFKLIMSGKQLPYTEYEFIHKDGTKILMEVKSTPFFKDGRFEKVISVARDITERKQVEEALRESVETARVLMNAPRDLATLVDKDGIIIDINDAMAKRFNKKIEDLKGSSGWELIPEILRETRSKYLNEVIQTSKPVRFEDENQGVWFDNNFYPILDQNGKVTKIAILVHDITEQKLAEQALRESEEKFRGIFEQAGDSIILIDINSGAILDFNEIAHNTLGYTQEEFQKLKLSDLDVFESHEETIEHMKKTMKNKKEVFYTKHMKKSGEIIDVQVRTGAISFGGNDYLMSIWSDITERKSVESELFESKERFLQVAANAQEWIWEVDTKGLYTYASPVVENILGYKPEEIVGKKHFYDLFHKDDREDLKNEAFKVFNQKLPFRGFINRNTHKNGKTVWLSTSSVPILDDESDLIGYRGADIDITERKKTEELLNGSLAEKELLLKEIHHRVKNNIQVIASLLNLHSSYIKDEKYIETFKEIQNRLRTMALIHEQLYQSKDMANIDFGKYVKELVNSLFRFSRTNIERIRPKLDVEDLSMGLDSAIPCALIINELVLNSMKHAFDIDSSGEIGIQVVIKEESETEKKIEVLIRDNGKGFPENLDFRNTGTFGLQLVITLVEQLGGTIELDRDGGTEFKINFIEKTKK